MCGTDQTEKVAEDCGMHRFVKIEDYAELFGYSVFRAPENRLDREAILRKLRSRFQTDDDAAILAYLENIEAVFILHDPMHWEESLSVRGASLNLSRSSATF